MADSTLTYDIPGVCASSPKDYPSVSEALAQLRILLLMWLLICLPVHLSTCLDLSSHFCSRPGLTFHLKCQLTVCHWLTLGSLWIIFSNRVYQSHLWQVKPIWATLLLINMWLQVLNKYLLNKFKFILHISNWPLVVSTHLISQDWAEPRIVSYLLPTSSKPALLQISFCLSVFLYLYLPMYACQSSSLCVLTFPFVHRHF